MSSFTVTTMKWHLGKPYEPAIRAGLLTLARFLDEHGLSTTPLAPPDGQVPDDFRIMSDNLTPDGLALYKECNVRWLNAIDRGKPPEDTKILEKALAKVRAKSSS